MHLDRETSMRMFKEIIEEILKDTDKDIGAILVAVNKDDTKGVRLLGFNLDEDELYGVLSEMTEILGTRILEEVENRTLN